ncbi:MAG: hypothetical protein GXY91_03850 [Clostridia bacterium]|nr:hypothetical protein [Clostridia bacterium]
MSKIVRDKIIAVMGAGLLGYYLGLSLFRGLIWSNLIKILPPINHRNLPDIYLGIIGAVVTGVLVYLLFTLLQEKRSFKKKKKKILIATALLIIAPFLVAGIFRIHAVSLVNKAESSTPKAVRISLDTEGNSIRFATSSTTASVLDKSFYLINSNKLDVFGKAIQAMELQEVVSSKEQKQNTHEVVMWIEYDANGKWYSKIVSYGQGLFEESVAGGKLAYYTNPQLEEFLNKLFTEAADINNYDRARVVNSVIMNKEDGSEEKILAFEEFQILVNAINPDCLLQEDTEGVKRIKNVLKEPVPQEDRNIYAFEIFQKDSNENKGRNFMVYDNLTQTLMFENKYYHVDLSDIIKDI